MNYSVFRKSFSLALIMVLLMLSSCVLNHNDAIESTEIQNIPTDKAAENISPKIALENALLNNCKITYTSQYSSPIYEEKVYLSEIIAQDQNSISQSQFAVLDMDGDSVPEVVFQRSDYTGFIILRYVNGEVYGYEISYRGLMDLKQDGSYSGSGGMNDVSVGKIRFLGKFYDTDVKMYSIGQDHISYYVHEQKVDKVIFSELWEEYEGLPNADWHEYTDSMVKEWLAIEFELLKPSAQPERQSIQMQEYLDSLSELLLINWAHNGDATEDKYNIIAQEHYDSWNQAMGTIYALCQEKQTDINQSALDAEQQQWLETREQRFLTTPISLIGDMTKMRTYQLISLYFNDHFYE